jgi:hypothetical protein
MVVVAQLVRASVCGTEGRGFESRLPPYFLGGYLVIDSLFFMFILSDSIRRILESLSIGIINISQSKDLKNIVIKHNTQ